MPSSASNHSRMKPHLELWLKGQKGRVTGDCIQYSQALAMRNQDEMKSSVGHIAAIMGRAMKVDWFEIRSRLSATLPLSRKIC